MWKMIFVLANLCTLPLLQGILKFEFSIVIEKFKLLQKIRKKSQTHRSIWGVTSSNDFLIGSKTKELQHVEGVEICYNVWCSYIITYFNTFKVL